MLNFISENFIIKKNNTDKTHKKTKKHVIY